MIDNNLYYKKHLQKIGIILKQNIGFQIYEHLPKEEEELHK